MVTFTTAKVLEQIANSSRVGTWDVPTNSNWGIVDAALGQTASIALNNSPVTLSAAQFQCASIVFTSTLTGNVAITFPTSFVGMYVIQNRCTGSSAFVVTLKTTSASNQVIGCKPLDTFDVFNDGVSLRYRNLGNVGSYWDYAGSSVPLWVSTCSVPPYLLCDGSAFSSATYPALTTILNGTTLPDHRGRVRATINSGTGRMTTATGGVDGNTIFASGGTDSITLTTAQIPAHTHTATVTDPTHTHNMTMRTDATHLNSDGGVAPGGGSVMTSCAAATGVTVSNANTGGSSLHFNMQPTLIGGITMIRAA